MPAGNSSQGAPAQGRRLTLGLRSSRASHHSTLGIGSSSMAGLRLSCARCPSGMALTSPTTLSVLAGLASSSPNSACAVIIKLGTPWYALSLDWDATDSHAYSKHPNTWLLIWAWMPANTHPLCSPGG